MDKPIIKVENLKREFLVGAQKVRALKGVSFRVNNGEFVTIMGTSGSGKSTLLNILGCLDQPTSGSYEIDSVPIRDLSSNGLAKVRNEKIGFVFQSYNLLPRTTALENVELPLLYNPVVSNKERRNRAMEALSLVGLGSRMDHTPNQLSGGQQQRVAIARALVNDPILILADEATGNLDSRTSYEIMALFQDLNAKGRTIAFVTHEHDIASCSKRTIVLKDGLVTKDLQVTSPARATEILESLPKEESEIA